MFDHVVFYIFVSDGNDAKGCEFHPKSNYKLPNAFGKWDYMYQANGWGQSFYTSEGASNTLLGKATTPAPVNSPAVAWEKLDDNAVAGIPKYVKPDWSSYNPSVGDVFADKPGMIWFKISASSIGCPTDLSGYKFYVNTWDFDMGSPRGVVKGDATRYKFGSGELDVDSIPLVCDESDNIITIE